MGSGEQAEKTAWQRAGTIGKESAMTHLKLQRALRRGGGLKMQEIGTERRERRKKGR